MAPVSRMMSDSNCPRMRPGNVLPVVTVLLVMLVGMVAFAVDTGLVALARTQLQATADAGTHAGLAKLYGGSAGTPDLAAARAEVRKYVGGTAANIPGLSVPDADIQFGLFTPTAAAGSRYTTTLGSSQANAVRVVLRRDGTTNPRLALFFAQILGRNDNDVQAQATAWVPQAVGVLAGAEVIPYVAQVDYFNAAAGLPARASNSAGFVSVSASDSSDNYSVGLPGSTPTSGHDGVKELVLFDSGNNNSPGNWGSIDLGTASNGTPELARQLRYGPNASDFAILKTAGKLAADGSLQAPVSLGGDPGISNGTKDDWAAIVGQNKIIPLYSTVSGNGNNTVYQIVGFAGVRIVAADLQGNPKQVWVQPTTFYSSKVSVAASGGAGSMTGVFGSPRLVVP